MVMTELQERAFISAAFTSAGTPESALQASEQLPIPMVLELYSDVFFVNVKRVQKVHRTARILNEDGVSKHLINMLTYGPNVDGELSSFLANSTNFHKKIQTLSPVEEYVYQKLGHSPYTLEVPSLNHSWHRFQAAAFSYVIKEWNEDDCHELTRRAGTIFEALSAKIVEAPRFKTEF